VFLAHNWGVVTDEHDLITRPHGVLPRRYVVTVLWRYFWGSRDSALPPWGVLKGLKIPFFDCLSQRFEAEPEQIRTPKLVHTVT
jgi:hypothetical protein